MKTASTIAALALVAGASAQGTSPSSIAMGAIQLLSEPCREAVLSLANVSSPIVQCLRVDALLPAILTNGSIIEPVDQYLTQVCSSPACTNETITTTVNTFIEGCSSDLAAFGVSNDTIAPYISEAYNGYLLARDIACLKTENNETTIDGNSTVNATGSYNTTNGTFCVTSLALEVQDYLGVNLTNQYVDTVALGGNSSALQAISSIPETAICNDCIFAAVELINDQYPAFGNITVSSNGTTIDGFLNATCSATPYNVTNDGELPESIYEAASNATSNATSTALPTAAAGTVSSVIESATASAAARRNVGAMAEKRRWIGQI